jgi:hypothetical protein
MTNGGLVIKCHKCIIYFYHNQIVFSFLTHFFIVYTLLLVVNKHIM